MDLEGLLLLVRRVLGWSSYLIGSIQRAALNEV